MGYPDNRTKRSPPNLQRQVEQLQALVADRGSTSETGRSGGRAVIRDEVAGQGSVRLQAVLLTAAPTAADYNALVLDVRAIAALLNKLGADFGWTA